MKVNLVSFVGGFIFALGLGLSGMTKPHKVTGFLDLFSGRWDPSLAFVMVGGVLVNSLLFYFIKGMPKPRFTAKFLLPEKTAVDRRLVIGSALFGLGWGICGFCPGPAIVAAVTLQADVLIFIAAMFAGMALYRFVFLRQYKA